MESEEFHRYSVLEQIKVWKGSLKREMVFFQGICEVEVAKT